MMASFGIAVGTFPSLSPEVAPWHELKMSSHRVESMFTLSRGDNFHTAHMAEQNICNLCNLAGTVAC